MRLVPVLLALCSGGVGLLAADDWPALPDEERELTELPGFPDAAAVVLRAEGELELAEGSATSELRVYRRIKVLRPEGRRFGTVDIASSDLYRMEDLQARVHLPDGRVLPLPPDARFDKHYSAERDRRITSFVLPEVVPGAIVEYRYRLRFDAFFHGEPWFFQDAIPTRSSRVVCLFPRRYEFQPHVVTTVDRPVAQERRGGALRSRIEVEMTELPPVPDEPGAPPFSELASRVTFVPTAIVEPRRVPLFSDWEGLVTALQGDRGAGYGYVRAHGRSARQLARGLAEGMTDPTARASLLHRFVRDRLLGDPWDSVTSARGLDQVLDSGHGNPLEKALLLQVMLEEVGLQASLGWSRPRGQGRLDRELVSPAQIGAALVVLQLEGEETFLDPSARTLGFGMLPPELEGVACLLVDGPAPRWITTPVTPSEGSVRRALLDLEVSPEGAVTGTGLLLLTGHHAGARMRWRATDELTELAWRRWLEEKLPGYDIGALRLEERPSVREVEVTWSMSLRRAVARQGEVALSVAAPVRMARQPFVMPARARRTPARLPFRDSDRLELTVRLPPGWGVRSAPRLSNLQTSAGRLVTEMSLERGGRILRLRRQMDTTETEFPTSEAYAELRELLQVAWGNDAEVVVVGAEAMR